VNEPDSNDALKTVLGYAAGAIVLVVLVLLLSALANSPA
jgi:hypothetical protein